MEKEELTTELEQFGERMESLKNELSGLLNENERMLDLYHELTKALIDGNLGSSSSPVSPGNNIFQELSARYSMILEANSKRGERDSFYQEVIDTHWTSLTDGTALEVAERLKEQFRDKRYQGLGRPPITEDWFGLRGIANAFEQLEQLEDFVVNAITEKRKAFYQSGNKDIGKILHKDRIIEIERQIQEEIQQMQSKLSESTNQSD